MKSIDYLINSIEWIDSIISILKQLATSELINRLMLMGNQEAEFIQTFQTGYRRNGQRHPHSWSIIDAEECVDWMKTLIEKE